MPGSSIQFDRPEAFLLLLLIVPVLWIAWRRLKGMSALRRWIVTGARVLVILLVAATIAQPKWMDRGEALSVIMLIDRSRSISTEFEIAALNYLKTAAAESENRQPIDRLAIINIGAEARIRELPDVSTIVDPGTPVVNLDATNLADGLNKALAIAPQDTATRILLVSDGNENVGSALEEANKVSSNKIPIDILRIEYQYDKEVMFDRIAAPSLVRKGQNIPINLILRSLKKTTGTVVLTEDGEPIDLDPGSESSGLRVQLEEGVNAIPITVMMDRQGTHRFRSEFRPDDPDDDLRTTNNVAESVVIVRGEGKVLLVRENSQETEELLRALTEAQIDVDLIAPLDVSSDVMALAGYDSIIIPNIPAFAFSPTAHEALRRYVHDVGGGMMMIGGPEGFGAGGWIDTPLEKALPVQLDPPDVQRMPKGALVCIMHSSEIPQGNYWGEQCAIAAINALSRLDMAGVIDLGQPPDYKGCKWEFPLQDLTNKANAIAAIKKMQMGDMPDFTPAMEMAYDKLMNVNVSQRHVIIISDGDPQPPSRALLNKYKAAAITVSTVVAGGHGIGQENATMKRIADFTGGKYYNPGNRFNQMPQIFWKEAVTVRRSLIVEGETYSATHHATVRPGPFRGRFAALPPFTGYVLTTAREGYAPEMVTNKDDPLFASWQYGLGKSAVFTSDATTRWATAWTTWSEFKGFWEQVVRWSMRPAAPSDMELAVHLDGQKAIVEAWLLTADGKYATFGQMEGIVLSPSLKSRPITLQQTGPGLGRAEFIADEPGSWVVNLVYHDPDGGARSIQAGISIPYSQEYRTVKDNAALLQELADRTGGRELPSDPAQANLFDRTGLEIPLSMTDLWTLIAIIASGMFLMDVAIRRIAFDREALLRRWYALRSRSAATAAESIGHLRTTRAEVQERLTGAGSSEEVASARRAAREASRSRFEAEEGSSAISVDEMTKEGDAGPGEGSLKKERRKPAVRSTKDESADDGEPMSRLLAAKRRAQGERERRGDRPKEEGGGHG